jgi:hypothetical protein
MGFLDPIAEFLYQAAFSSEESRRVCHNWSFNGCSLPIYRVKDAMRQLENLK